MNKDQLRALMFNAKTRTGFVSSPATGMFCLTKKGHEFLESLKDESPAD